MIGVRPTAIRGARQYNDRRCQALVLIGFIVLIPHLVASLSFLSPEISNRSSSEQGVVWLSKTAFVSEGLYWINKKGNQSQDDLKGSFEGQGDSRGPQSTQLPVQVAPILFRPIQINKADRNTLMIIPGIGAANAEAIVRYRDRQGAIKDKADLTKIEGIGSKKATVIEAYVNFEE